jgi:NADH-quinone oxidoreductase subunit L
MTGPLLLLGLLATVSGFFVFDAVGELFGFSGGIGYLVYLHDPHAFHIDWAFASIATVSSLTGVIIGWVYWHGGAERAIKARTWSPDLHALLVNRYYLDELYQGIVNRVVLGLAGIVAWFDKKIVNETGVDGGAQFIGYFGYRLKFLQTGKIPNYALGIATGILVLSVMVLARA